MWYWTAAIALILCFLVFRRGPKLIIKDIAALPLVFEHLVFSVVYLPLYLRILWFYNRDPYIRNTCNIRYGPKKHHVLDLFVPPMLADMLDLDFSSVSKAPEYILPKLPVVVFVYGGAWSSGDKNLYPLLGKQLRNRGIVAVFPNYSLYPKAVCRDMVMDLSCAMAWVRENIGKYGGDPANIIVMGHSAGAHLSSMLLLHHAVAERGGSGQDLGMEAHEDLFLHPVALEGPKKTWKGERHADTMAAAAAGVRGCITLGGAFDIAAHYEFEKKRGVAHLSGMRPAMGHPPNFDKHSPSLLVGKVFRQPSKDTLIANGAIPTESNGGTYSTPTNRALSTPAVRYDLPWFHHIHSEADGTVPISSSEKFHEQLLSCGIRSSLTRMKTVGHSEMVIDMMEDGRRFYKPMYELLTNVMKSEHGAVAQQ